MSNEGIPAEAASSEQHVQVKPHALFLASLQSFDRMFNWLSGLLHMTEKEQEEAGIAIRGMSLPILLML
ncbi:MAG: hypothetical protein P4L50_19450 [Anaerolineaceae bacterium]|nr:hypothetical protein [Anaerolineaceae bacterium]